MKNINHELHDFLEFGYRADSDVEDASTEAGPKNETLAEHRKHCEAEPGNCPFEKKLDECDTEIGKRDKKRKGNGVTPSEDAAYADAVKRGDRETALRMIREAAAKAGAYNNGLLIRHNTDKTFNVFDMSKASPDSVLGSAIYASIDKDGEWVVPNKDKHMDMFVFGDILDLSKPLNGSDETRLKKYSEIDPRVEMVLHKKFASASNLARKAGYSAIIHKGPTGQNHIAVLNPNNVKSADITYDDAGNLIPLSKRFNMDSVDIRDEATGKIRKYLDLVGDAK